VVDGAGRQCEETCVKRQRGPFDAFDLGDFWSPSKYARQKYVDDPLTDKKVSLVERVLKVKLPPAYVALMKKTQNGGIPKKKCHRTTKPTSWAEDHVAIAGIFSIGETQIYSLCGRLGSQFMIDEWGYPPIGVYFADCPSAGHDMLALDYRAKGPRGEPAVVHVDQERDYAITSIAPSFEDFIRGLEDEAVFGDPDEQPPPPLLWKAKAIKVEVEREHPSRGGQCLYLTQKLRKGESGWSERRIDLPARWQISSAKIVGDEVVVVRKGGETYRLGPDNVGPLSFAILDGADEKSDAKLAALWKKHAGS
jgi:hypothetical protein